jgi:hypothetical protein
VTDRDRDSTRQESQPGVSHASSPVLNTTQFLARRPSADLARRKSPRARSVRTSRSPAAAAGLLGCCGQASWPRTAPLGKGALWTLT